MSRLVYSKGTLLAYLQDKILSSHDEGLENVVRLVFTNRAEVLGNSALGGLIKKFSNGNLGKSFQDYVLGGKELPDMGFKSGTGKSGCARFLPAP